VVTNCVFGRDVDGDEILSRLEKSTAVGYDCGEWKVVRRIEPEVFEYGFLNGSYHYGAR